jgi:F-type H+-transporting ATPase subunit gamma
MATLREIRRRIASVKSTQKITRAMKMVAAAKLRKAQENIVNARPYAYKLGSLIKHLALNEEVKQNPFISYRDLKSQEAKKVLLVVVTADRSLCGAFNSSIIRKVNHLLEEDFVDFYAQSNLKLLTVGRKGYDHFRKRSFPIVNYYVDFFRDMHFGKAQGVVATCVKEYLEMRADEVYVLYNEFKSAMQQQLVLEKFLPVEPEKMESTNAHHAVTDYLYEPDRNEIINTLVPRHMNVQMWRIMLESFAAEMGARMTAMDTATENAGELINDLTLFYNRARQAAITKEILEVVSGAEALQKQ